MGGGFSTIAQASRNGIARLTFTGSNDTSFNPGSGASDGVVYSVGLQADGKIVIGGAFRTFNAATRYRVVRLNAEGSLDTSFSDPGVGMLWVRSLALQPDHSVLIAGAFTTVGQTGRTNIARLYGDDPNDDVGHGTHVSGILGAVGNNGKGVAGVAWQVQVMVCKFLRPADPTPQYPCLIASGFVSDAITCINYAISKHANIINASWGDYTTNDIVTNPGAKDNGILDLDLNNRPSLHDAINAARTAGIIFVAACGNDSNDNDTNKLYPASYTDLDNIIAVAATDSSDQLVANFGCSSGTGSNFGATTVHLGAPGKDILSCWNGWDSQYVTTSGTSMAAPHVAGVCALVWAHHSAETYLQIKNRLLSNTDPLPTLAGKCQTGGRVNLQKALP